MGTVASVVPGRSERSGKVAVLSFSRIFRDRRVLRQCALLVSLGHPPLVVGYAELKDEIPHRLAHWPVPRRTVLGRLRMVARQLPAHLSHRAALAGFWTDVRHRWALDVLKDDRPNLVIANDWPALVVAAEYKNSCQEEKAPFIHYDAHEFATLEFDESRWWRIVHKPMVVHLEGSSIASADSVSTVGPKLAEALQKQYQLAHTPAVVRNIPNRIFLPELTPPHWPLRILYHGQVLPDRGLEALIDSMPRWTEPHRLTIRGDGDSGYIRALKARVALVQSSERVTFEQAVPAEDVMPIAARTADIGVHFTPLDTEQRHFSLPNKLFEYIGAGLAVAVSPGVDLRRIVQEYRVGVVSRDPSPAAIADALNSLTPRQVGCFKVLARLAASELCWEVEQSVLRSALTVKLMHM